MARLYQPWGRFPRIPQQARSYSWRADPLSIPDGTTILPFGNGRSYGDSCLNEGGLLLDVRGLNRFIAFDPLSGRLQCEAGVTLAEILALAVPQGWFLPVTPGTQFATVGGAIANDVHGKNHHRAGTFGTHVRCFEIVRSTGERLVCSATMNNELFAATVGGLGLTGMVLWAELALRRIHNPFVTVETIRYGSLDEFFELSAQSDKEFEYTVAWVDCLARGGKLGRGLFSRGNHAASQLSMLPPPSTRSIRLPFDAPGALLNKLSISLFNTLYYHRQRRRTARDLVHFVPFFYPLDAIGDWNRLYGKSGFLQYQCVVPMRDSDKVMREILARIAKSRVGSFLAVLKVFGDVKSPGMLSFPRPGVTLALDFPNRGQTLFRLLDELDELVRQAGGAVYPAKDARMSPQSFATYFPNLDNFKTLVDPSFSSSFWRRVTR